tara:strand:+ start:2346 stop:2549 length:204 start_codon:yes stop_codon:yes gene_type:complete
MSDQEQIDEAIKAHIEKHGTTPKAVMLGEAVWRERADRICAGMNRTGPNSEVVIHRLPKGCEGVVCA